jgi:hypothetical protein
MKAVEIMTTGVVTVPPEASVKEAANLMLEHGVSGLPGRPIDGCFIHPNRSRCAFSLSKSQDLCGRSLWNNRLQK